MCVCVHMHLFVYIHTSKYVHVCIDACMSPHWLCSILADDPVSYSSAPSTTQLDKYYATENIEANARDTIAQLRCVNAMNPQHPVCKRSTMYTHETC